MYTFIYIFIFIQGCIGKGLYPMSVKSMYFEYYNKTLLKMEMNLNVLCVSKRNAIEYKKRLQAKVQ
jgi:hypothetical protein